MTHTTSHYSRIYRDLADNISDTLAFAQGCSFDTYLSTVKTTYKRYLSFSGPSHPPDELINAKFLVMHWKKVVSDNLFAELQHTNNERDIATAFDLLSWMTFFPRTERLQDFFNAFACLDKGELAMKSFAHYLASNRNTTLLGTLSGGKYREELKHYTGPVRHLNMGANRTSPYSNYKRWMQIDDMGRYKYRDDGVVYAGMTLRPGDIFLCNTNMDGNGVFTATTEPRNCAYHLGVFVILHDSKKQFPCVVETYEKGLRATPLSEFLSKKFSTTIEVFRFKERCTQYEMSVEKSAIEALDKVKGYNFYTEDPDYTYMSCPVIARFIIEKSGREKISTKSMVANSWIQKNLRTLGYDGFVSHFPIDYAMDERLERVAFFDNDQFEDCLCREILERKFTELLSTREWNINNFPLMFKIYRFGIEQLKKGSSSGKILGALFGGFNKYNIPKGPTDLMAVVAIVEHGMIKANRIGRKELVSHIDWERAFMLDEYLKTDGLDQAATNAYRHMDKWFK